ncbi:MAG: sulfotransferase [Alicyclobacillus sp.]|nr:sulfotransferase [Alicyclobacillus sp.]
MDILISGVTQRCGSTLVQRIFNARPKTLVWGENGGALSFMADMLDRLAYFSEASKYERAAYFGYGENPNLWIANMTPELPKVNNAVIESVRQLYHSLYCVDESHDFIGMKEVRMGKRELNIFRVAFPECKIVLLVRHPYNIWRSVPRGQHPEWITLEALCKLYSERVSTYLELTAADDRCRILRYEDLVRRDPSTLSWLSDWAKISVSEIEAVLQHVIGSARGGEIPVVEEYEILRHCEAAMQALRYFGNEPERAV